jgi:hypothetical protein
MRFPLLVRDALALLDQHGLSGEVKSGTHHKITFTNGHGRRCLLVIARSPSSRRAFKQNRAELRRLLRRQSRT